MNTKCAALLSASLSVISCASCADMKAVQDIANVLAVGMAGSNEGSVAAGLREALRVGSERTVAAASRPGGFGDNPLLRIALPSEVQTMAKALRLVGMGAQVDELDAAMNRAAEKASAEATPVFWNAIAGMSLTDAVGILNGGDTAATEYFRERTATSLQQRFRPIIESNMREVGLYKTYKQVLDAYSQLPLVNTPSLDLTEHVTGATLDGLFKVLGDEETKIRRDPAARTTDLLRQVFGNQ